MPRFMDEHFLLPGPTARKLYHEYAAAMPIVDYHCHIPAQEIAEDVRFENITRLWLGADHYKWRLIRAAGIDEARITGGSSDRDKFMAFAEALPRAAGNPLYHWTHLELRRFFDCELTLNPQNAEAIWEHCNARLGAGGLSARQLMARADVRAICTTDDPTDDLRWHRQIARDAACACRVYPAFRPDRALYINRPDFAAYIEKLAQACGGPVRTMDDLYGALHACMDRFEAAGCRAADQGMESVVFVDDPALAAHALRQALAGECVGVLEEHAYRTALMLFLGREYARRGWVMEIHYGVIRNVNTPLCTHLGPDTGFDCLLGEGGGSRGLLAYLDALACTGELPRTILFSLNPNDNVMLASVAGSFPCGGTPGHVQPGAAWWYNDTRDGMEAQLRTFASVGVLGSFVGMLTDSRSFLSYTRHEYFRRILCGLLGGWVDAGEYPADMDALGAVVQDISYHNAVRFLRLDV